MVMMGSSKLKTAFIGLVTMIDLGYLLDTFNYSCTLEQGRKL